MGVMRLADAMRHSPIADGKASRQSLVAQLVEADSRG
jgi:hypothetical protein